MVPFSRTCQIKCLLLGLTRLIDFSYNQHEYICAKGKEMRKISLGILFAFALAGCGQVYDREPVGVGYDNNELKLSPCACIMVYQA